MKNNKMMIVILLVVVIAVAVGAWWYLNREPAEKFADYSPGDYFVTNVYESKRLLKVSVVLRLNTDKSKVQEKVFTANNSKIRDRIITILREQDEVSLLDPGTQDLLKQRIRDELNGMLESNYIKEIHFNDFVVQ